MLNNRIFRVLLVWMKNGTATLESNSALLHKVKYILTIWFANPIPRYILKRNEHIGSHKNLYTIISSNIIHKNYQKLETIQLSFNEWMDKQNIGYPCNEILLRNEEEWIISTGNSTWVNFKVICWVKESLWEDYIMCNFYKIFWKRQCCRNREQIRSVLHRIWKVGRRVWLPKGNMRNFLDINFYF